MKERGVSLSAAPRLEQGATAWAAFSGGLDSTVLLHLLKGAGLPLKALHVNHHLQGAASRWVEHCREGCARLDVPIYVMDVKIDPNDPSGPEGAARKARYDAIRSLMKPGDVLATAHHQDDQAETVLLRLLRGSGVAGLAAMRALSDFPPGRLWRPLLGYSRAELRRYAEAHGLSWVEDPHNLDPRFSRTFLRNELFPRLTQRWPQAVELLARTADHCADAMALLDEAAARDFRRARRGEGLSVRALLALPRARRDNLVRHWVVQGGFPPPPLDAVQRLEKEILRAGLDRAPCLGWGEAELRRFRDTLFRMQRLPPAPTPGAALEWDGRRDLELPPGCGWLRVKKPGSPLPEGGDRGGVELPLRVTFPKGGERIKPAGSRFTRTLRNLFQEEAVPPWVRERLPLLELDGELAAVGARWQTAAFRRLRRARRLAYAWQHALAGAPASL